MRHLNDDLAKKVSLSFELLQAGNIIFEDDEIDELIEYVKDEYENSIEHLENTSFIFKKSLFVLIVNIAKKWGTNQNNDEDKYFFRSIFEKIFDDRTITLDKFKDFKLFCDKYRPSKWLKDNNGNTTRYKQTFLYNAFSPIEGVYGFIDIIIAAYNDESNMESGFFDQKYEESPETYIEFVNKYAEKLKNMSEDLENVNLYGGSYKLSTAFRHAFIWDTNAIARLISKTITYIKNFIKCNPVKDETYYYQIVNKYLNYRKKDINYRKNNYDFIEKVHSVREWYAYYSFDYENNKLNLTLPLLKLQSLNQYNNLKLKIYYNEQCIRIITLPIVGEDYNPHINSISVDISDAIKDGCNINFSFEILDDMGIILPRNTNLFREYLLFCNKNSRENRENYIKPVTNDVVLISSNKDYLDNITAEYDRNPDFIYCYYFTPNKGDFIKSINRSTFFVDNKDNFEYDINGDEVKYATFVKNLYKAPVYNKIENIILHNSFLLKDSDALVLHLEHYNEDFTTKEMFNKTLILNKKSVDRDICLNFEKFDFLNKQGFNHITLYETNLKKNIVDFSYFICDLKLIIEKGLPHDELINVKMSLGEIINDKKYNIKCEYITQPFFGGNIVIKLPLLKYKLVSPKTLETYYLSINDSDNEVTNKRNIFNPINDGTNFLYNSYLEIENLYDFDYEIYIDDNLITSSNNKYFVGEYITKNNKQNNIFIKINNKLYLLYSIYKKETILSDDIDLEFEEDEFYYSINDFIGEEMPLFKIKFYDEFNRVFESPILDEISGNFKINEFKPGIYSYEVIRVYYTSDFEDGEILLRDLNEYEIGDLIPFQFESKYIDLVKIPKHGNCKYSIRNIVFDKYNENGDPIFIGYISGRNMRKEKIFFIPKSKNLKLYYDVENYLKFYYDDKNQLIIKNKLNEKDKEITSVYFKEVVYV